LAFFCQTIDEDVETVVVVEVIVFPKVGSMIVNTM
jgi:hypothetical protein